MINVWTKYGEPWLHLYGNGETDLITKFYIVNHAVVTCETAKPIL